MEIMVARPGCTAAMDTPVVAAAPFLAVTNCQAEVPIGVVVVKHEWIEQHVDLSLLSNHQIALCKQADATPLGFD